MPRRTKASRRAAFRRAWARALMTATMAPIEGRGGPWDATRGAEWSAAVDWASGATGASAMGFMAAMRATPMPVFAPTAVEHVTARVAVRLGGGA